MICIYTVRSLYFLIYSAFVLIAFISVNILMSTDKHVHLLLLLLLLLLRHVIPNRVHHYRTVACGSV